MISSLVVCVLISVNRQLTEQNVRNFAVVILFIIKMLPLLVLLVSSAVLADDCQHMFEGFNYTRSSILTIKGLPTNLVINPHTKDLLFTLIDLDSLQDDDVQTKMDQYILKGGNPIKIEDVNGQAAAVDVENDHVYIASDDGLYLLNDTDKVNFVSLKQEDIVQLFKTNHNEDLYAVTYPDHDVYRINVEKNEKKRIENIPCAFILAVDDQDNIFYECDSKYVKVLLKDFNEPVEFVGIAKNAARAITVDSNHRVVLATNDGLYHLRANNLIPKKLMNLDYMASGIAFDGPDIYISTVGIVYKYEVCE